MLETSIWQPKAVGIGLAVGLIIGGAALSFGQELGAQSSAGQDAGVSVLQAQLDALTERIADLEKAEREPKTAPFTVADAEGKPIFTVADEGGGASVYLYGPRGTISLNASDRLSLLIDSGGASSVKLGADADGPGLELRNGDASVVAGADGGAMSLVVQQGANKATLRTSEGASLSIDSGDGYAYINADGDGPSLLFHKGDANIVAGTSGDAPTLSVEKGPNKATLKASDQASLSIDSGDGSAYIATDSDGPSLLFHKGDANISAGKNGGAMSLVVQNGQNSTELSAGGESASVSVDEAGRSVKLGSADSTFGLSTLVGSERVAALGDRGDGTYSLRVYKKGATLPVLQAGVLASGDAGLIVGDGTDQFVRVEGKDHEGVVQTFKGGTEIVTLGKTKTGSGLLVAVGTQHVSAQVDSSSGPEIDLTLDGYEAFRVATDDNTPQLLLGDNAGPLASITGIGGSGAFALSKGSERTITLGPTFDDPQPAIRAYGGGGKKVLTAGVNDGAPDSGHFYVGSAGALVAGIEGSKGGGAVFVKGNGKEVASMNSVDKPGEGLVVVRKGGVALAALGYSGAGGGSVTVTDPSGNGVFSAEYDGKGPGSACVSHKGTKCLGVALTGMEGFH